ncbi:MAG: nickel permease [Pseudomonadota bacterium]
MTALDGAAPGLVVILMLGMRHGLDPDHLAAIDGLTMRASQARPRWAPWMGGLFALGHGLVVMLIIAATALASARWRPSAVLFDWLEWLPAIFLLLLAGLNARALRRGDAYRLTGLRGGWLPPVLRRAQGPLPALMVGMVFALVFDTAVQAAAWGYAASALGGMGGAMLIGLTFTCGMAMTDTLDGWVGARVLRSGRQDALIAFRRRMGWPIVGLCVAVALYLIAGKLLPGLSLPEHWYGVLGGLMMAGMMLLYGITLFGLRRNARPAGHC